MWRCTWFHWTPAGPVRFTVARLWNHSPRWVSMKASAFLFPQRPWQCVLCSCPSARWDPRLRRSYWWVWSADMLHRVWNWDSEPTDDGSRRTKQDRFYSVKLLHCWCAASLIQMQTLVCCVFFQGTAQLSLADCEGSVEMVYHWLRVQMLSGTELPRHEQKTLNHRRHYDCQEEQQRPRALVNTSIMCK